MRVDSTPVFTLGEIARALDGRLDGDPDTQIRRLRDPRFAGANEIAVVTDPKYFGSIDALAAAAVVVPNGAPHLRRGVIVVSDAKRAFVTILHLFARPSHKTERIHPRAIVSEDARLGERVSVGPGAVIEGGTTIGDDVTIGANCFIGEGAVIGNGTTLHANVTLYERTVLGRRVIIHSGTVIGSDGFGFLESATGAREKIPQIGIVEIGDDVEIGANCGIDRATLEKTTIGRGTKIDNLVQIGHNTQIGEHCCIVGQAGIAGSATIGSYVVLSGQAGISDHVTVGDHVVLGAQAGIHSDVHSGAWIGSPAIPYERALRVFATLPSLPEYRERVRTLEALLSRLEKRLLRLEQIEISAPVGAGNGNGNGRGNGSYGTESVEET